MAAQVGFPGLEVTDGSYGGSYGSYGCPGRLSRPQSYGPGRLSQPQSYGRFLWIVPMVPMAAQAGFPGLKVTDVSCGFMCVLWLPR